MSQVKLIVEIDGSLSKRTDDILMESKSRSNDKRCKLLNCWFKSLEMADQES